MFPKLMIGVKFEFHQLTSRVVAPAVLVAGTVIVTVSSPHSLHVAKNSFIVSTDVTKPAGQTQDWPILRND